jgi:hypothetical protein
MIRTRTTRLVVGLATISLVAAACGGDDDTDTADPAPPVTDAPADDDADEPGTTDAPADPADPAEMSLADVCPSPFVIQTDWFPESEHGALYELIGEGYTVDTGERVVRGPMVSQGEEVGIEVEVRTGGPAIGFSDPRVQMYTDESIHLAYSTNDSQAIGWENAPTISVMAPLDKNPQIIMWDPEVYPDVETIADLGEEGVVVNVFGGGGFSDVFVAQGIWSADQVDPSYDGSPARFIAEGNIAQQGFASAEPYNYEFVFEEFGRPVAFELLHDAGYVGYSQTLGVRADRLEELRPCLEQVIPVIQQAAVDYPNDPDRANAIIIDAVEQYEDFWVYDEGIANFAVDKMLELGLMGNGHDDTVGTMDGARIQQVIDDIRDAGINIPDDLTAEDMYTNEFLDPSIGF